jgi:hypothetical protein
VWIFHRVSPGSGGWCKWVCKYLTCVCQTMFLNNSSQGQGRRFMQRGCIANSTWRIHMACARLRLSIYREKYRSQFFAHNHWLRFCSFIEPSGRAIDQNPDLGTRHFCDCFVSFAINAFGTRHVRSQLGTVGGSSGRHAPQAKNWYVLETGIKVLRVFFLGSKFWKSSVLERYVFVCAPKMWQSGGAMRC